MHRHRLVALLWLLLWPWLGSAQSTSETTAAFGDEQLRVLTQRVQSGTAARTEPDMLRQRVGQAVRQHPQTRAAEAGLVGAAAATREAESQGLPQVAFSAEAGHRRTDSSSIFDTPKRAYDSGSMTLNARQTFVDWGAVRAATNSGRERERAIAARAVNRRNELGLQALQAWSDVARSRERLRLLDLNVQALEQMIDFLGRREALGAGARSDVWRAQSRLADARAALAGAAATAAAATAAWREIFGTEPDPVLNVPTAPALAALSPTAAAELVARHPALVSAEAARQANDFDRESLEASQRPQLSAELSATRRDWMPPARPGTDLTGLVVLRHNFYSGGGDDARRAQARSRVLEATEQARAVRQQVERALAQSQAEDLAGAAVLAARRESVLQAAQALRAVRELFANRRGTLLELLAAQEALHAAGIGLVDAEAEAALARWRLLSFDEPAFAETLGLAPITPIAPIAPITALPAVNALPAPSAPPPTR